MNKIDKNNSLRSSLIAGLIALSLSACGGESGSSSFGNNNPSRLDTVLERGSLICGVNGQLPGFSFVNENGEYSGMDVDICRAVAAALFNDPNQVEYRDLSAQERFTALQTGEVDLLSRNTTWTMSRDTSIGMEFAPTIFYDGQGLMVTKSSKIKQLACLLYTSPSPRDS